jgi:hypothetical protein
VIALAVAALIGFSSPSGNIKCEASTTLLVCSIEQSAYGKRLQDGCINPKGEMGAGVDWHGFSLTPRGKGKILCTSGAMFAGVPPRFPKLPYSVPWKVGPFSCVVKTAGVTCVNARSHGVFVSRAGYRLF